MTEKEFGKLSSQQFGRLLALVHKGLDEQSDLEAAIGTDPEKVSNFVKDKAHWSIYYELPYPHFLGLFFIALGLGDKIKKFATLSDPQEAVISWAESDPMPPTEPDKLSDEEEIIMFGLMMAMTRNFSAIQQFYIPINSLIEKAKEDEHFKKIEKNEAVFWEGAEEDDPIKPKIDSIISKFEETTKKVIKGEGTLYGILNYKFWESS